MAIINPQTGEQPLNTDFLNAQWGQGPWQGAGGGQTAQEYYAGKKFLELFGRNPTASELAQFSGAYANNPNQVNESVGNQAVAQYYQSQANSPENQYAQQQQQYLKGAPQHYDSINQLFQSSLGRAANQEELDHFGSLLASGQVDPYTVGQFLSQLPESVKRQDEEFRKNLTGELQGQDQRYFSEQIMPGIQSAYAKQGRSFESSGFQNALAQSANQQNLNRESFLSNLSASQYQGNRQNAYEQYLNSLGRYQGLQDYSRSRSAQLADASQSRLYDIQNFNMQKNAYDDYLRRYGKRGGWVNDLGTSLNFANSFTNLFKGWGGGGSAAPVNTQQASSNSNMGLV